MITKTNIASQIVDHLRKDIILGKYRKGEALVETALSHELGVSRGPVREAIGKLVAENLLEKHSNGRTAVTGFEQKDIENLYDTRILLETHALGQIDPEMFNANKDRLLLYIQQMEEADYYKQRDIEIDLAFHHLLVRMADNNSLMHLWSAQRDIFRTLIDITSEAALKDQEKIIRQHKAIVQALAENEVEQARQLLATHLRQACEYCCSSKELKK
ncbi:GntR family transcriptional regulator [Salinicoccus luteus]|uniref:GntR family transcriptional regulator n=1 Tax=Salinicoccus luteus TaxID=367840 RepID=UPI0004E1D9DC|nr:GntR family transcriptional regulator [Salinicoccus luteus]